MAEEIDWSLTTFEGVERETMRRHAKLPLEEIIRIQDALHDRLKTANPEAYAAWMAERRRSPGA